MAESAVFVWEGTDKAGKKTKGEISSVNPAIAKAELRRQGINASKVRKKSQGLSLGGGGKIKPADIALFTRQMATMMRAGVPLVQAFEIVADGLDKHKVAALIRNLRNDVASGNWFASSIRKHPEYFDDLFCNLVDAGEQSGALETMLDRVATYKEKTESLKAKVKKAMTYPIAGRDHFVKLTATEPLALTEAEFEFREFDGGRGVMDLADQVVFQDWQLTAGQQAGWRSRGYQEPYLAAQETRVRRFHEVLNDNFVKMIHWQ